MDGHLVAGIKVAVFLCPTIQLRIVHGPVAKAWKHVDADAECIVGKVWNVQLKG